MKFIGFAQCYKNNLTINSEIALKLNNNGQIECSNAQIEIAGEFTIQLIINKEHIINILVSPQQLESFVVGYLKSEGFINKIDEIELIEYKLPNQIWIFTNTSLETIDKETELRTSGCVGIKQKPLDPTLKIPIKWKISPNTIFKCQDTLVNQSVIWKSSGGAHISGLFSQSGNLAYFSEDIGRHNTVDKVIGQAMMDQKNTEDYFLITSGRLSAAMVLKAIHARIPVIISKAAPLTEGLRLAKQAQVTLIGFSRRPNLNIYSHIERIIF